MKSINTNQISNKQQNNTNSAQKYLIDLSYEDLSVFDATQTRLSSFEELNDDSQIDYLSYKSVKVNSLKEKFSINKKNQTNSEHTPTTQINKIKNSQKNQNDESTDDEVSKNSDSTESSPKKILTFRKKSKIQQIQNQKKQQSKIILEF